MLNCTSSFPVKATTQFISFYFPHFLFFIFFQKKSFFFPYYLTLSTCIFYPFRKIKTLIKEHKRGIYDNRFNRPSAKTRDYHYYTGSKDKDSNNNNGYYSSYRNGYGSGAGTGARPQSRYFGGGGHSFTFRGLFESTPFYRFFGK